MTGGPGWLGLLMALLLGVPSAHQGAPNQMDLKPPSHLHGKALAQFRAGATVVGESGCEGCHRIGQNGNDGPGPPLTHIGSRRSAAQLSAELKNPTAPMPSFAGMAKTQPRKFHEIVNFLSELR